jgi:hypothetical protein
MAGACSNAAKKRKRAGPARELDVFLRGQALKAQRRVETDAPDAAVETAFPVYRASYRFADLMFDGSACGLPPLNSCWPTVIRQLWTTAVQGRHLTNCS